MQNQINLQLNAQQCWTLIDSLFREYEERIQDAKYADGSDIAGYEAAAAEALALVRVIEEALRP